MCFFSGLSDARRLTLVLKKVQASVSEKCETAKETKRMTKLFESQVERKGMLDDDMTKAVAKMLNATTTTTTTSTALLGRKSTGKSMASGKCIKFAFDATTLRNFHAYVLKVRKETLSSDVRVFFFCRFSCPVESFFVRSQSCIQLGLIRVKMLTCHIEHVV